MPHRDADPEVGLLGDVGHPWVSNDQLRPAFLRLEDLASLLGRAIAENQVERDVLEQLAGAINDRALAAGALPGIDADHGASAERRSHQQLTEVLREHVDGAAIGGHLVLDPHVALDAREQQALERVLEEIDAPRH